MSEDAAFRRSRAARLVREYPELHDIIAKGEIHLTGVLMIGPHLGGERHAEILQRARFRSKREILRLIARIDPKPEVPALVEPIGPAPIGRATWSKFMEALSGPVRQLPPGQRPEDWMDESAHDTEASIATIDDQVAEPPMAAGTEAEKQPDQPSLQSHTVQPMDSEELPTPVMTAEPERPLHYRVQFTASQEFVD